MPVRTAGRDAGSGSDIIAGTKAGSAGGRLASNDRRQISSSEREIPWRRAVADTSRGPCKLSRTMRSFSSSDHRRRRPVSTIARRCTGCALYV